MKIDASRCRFAAVSSFVGLFALSSLPGPALGADGPETYAVASVCGDALSVISYQPGTGTNLDRNVQQHVAMADRHLDELATQVSTSAIRRAVPDARVEPIVLPDAARADDVDAALPTLLAEVRGRLAQPDTHYLVVIGKFRGDAHLRTAHGTLGSGKLEGIGFYIDRTLRMRRTATGESGRGFIAPFAYLSVSLVDLRTGALVRSEPAMESTTRANVGTDTTLDPWDSMTSEEKVRLLDVVVRRALLLAVPRVLAPT